MNRFYRRGTTGATARGFGRSKWGGCFMEGRWATGCADRTRTAHAERAKNTVRPEFYDFLFQKDFIVLSTVSSSLALGGRRNFLIIPKRAAICRLSLKTHI